MVRVLPNTFVRHGLRLPPGGRVAAPSGDFAPSDLPALEVWLEADAITGVADGAAVATWTDASANAHAFAQGTGTKQPLWIASGFNGLPVTRWDGSNDDLTNATAALGTSCSIYVVCRTDLVGGFKTLLANELNVFVGMNNREWTSFYGNNAAWGTTATHGTTESALHTQHYCFTSVNDAGTVRAFVNGLAFAERANAMSAFSTGLTVGSNQAGTTQFFDGDVAAILVYDAAHTAAERKQVWGYLHAKYALGYFAGPFTRDAGNPVVALGAGGSWEDSDVANPDVLPHPDGGWIMQYSGYDGTNWGTGLAFADDLAGPWAKSPNNPVLVNTGPEGGLATNGGLVYRASDQTYYLAYQSKFGGTNRIHMATSTDLVTFTRLNSGDPVIPLGGSGEWDELGTQDPMLRLLADDTFELWYGGDSTGGFDQGRATSSDGVTWVKIGAEFGVPSYAGSRPGEPFAFAEPDGLYVTHDVSDLTNRWISMQFSADDGASWSGWQKHVLVAGTAGQWDDTTVFDSAVVVHEGVLHLFYGGGPDTDITQGFGIQIGLATTPWDWG
jgi:hypothetical protein